MTSSDTKSVAKQFETETDPDRGAALGAALGAADLKDEPPALPPDLAASASPGTAAETSRIDAARVAAAMPDKDSI